MTPLSYDLVFYPLVLDLIGIRNFVCGLYTAQLECAFISWGPRSLICWWRFSYSSPAHIECEASVLRNFCSVASCPESHLLATFFTQVLVHDSPMVSGFVPISVHLLLSDRRLSLACYSLFDLLIWINTSYFATVLTPVYENSFTALYVYIDTNRGLFVVIAYRKIAISNWIC